MRALVYTAPLQVAIEDRPRPQAAEDEIEIAIASHQLKVIVHESSILPLISLDWVY